MKASLALAIFGALLICGGSYVAIASPGDEKSVKVTLPMWFFGGALGLTAILLAGIRGHTMAQRLTIGALALIALATVIWSIMAGASYARRSAKNKISSG